MHVWLLVERVELRRRDDLHAFGDRRVPELGTGVRLVERQLAADDLEVLHRIAAAERGDVDEVDEVVLVAAEALGTARLAVPLLIRAALALATLTPL